MGAIGKLLGFLFLFLLGIPLLIACLWASGITTAMFSGTFFENLSNRVIERIPGLADQSFEATRQGDAAAHPDSRLWADAIGKAGLTPGKIMEQTGLGAWLKNDLAVSLSKVDAVFTGSLSPANVVLDLRPLKQALSGEPTLELFRLVTAQLPPCDESGLAKWKRLIQPGDQDAEPPACNPGSEAFDQGREWLHGRIQEIPDSKPLFDQPAQVPPFGIFRAIHAFFWALFLLPALLIILGAAMAGRDRRGFFFFGGGTVVAGSTLSLFLASMIGGLMLTALSWFQTPWITGTDSYPFRSEAGHLLASQIMNLAAGVTADLFSPVLVASWISLGVGLLLIACGFLIQPTASR